MDSSDSYQLRKDSYSYRLVHMELDNIGKTDLSLGSETPAFSVIYDNDYTFTPQKIWYYNPNTWQANMKKQGAWVNTSPTIGAFDEPVKCIQAFLLPDEVLNSDKSSTLVIATKNNTYEMEFPR